MTETEFSSLDGQQIRPTLASESRVYIFNISYMSYQFHGTGLASSKIAVLTAAKAASF